MSQERKNLEDLKAEVIAFKGSKVHDLFIRETNRDLSVVEERILDDEIVDVKDIFELLDMRGQRRVLKANLTIWEDAVSTLTNRIEELILAEQPNDTQQETEE